MWWAEKTRDGSLLSKPSTTLPFLDKNKCIYNSEYINTTGLYNQQIIVQEIKDLQMRTMLQQV